VSPPAERPRPADPRWLAPAAIAVALVPLVVAAVRAVATDWYPIGDNAYFPLRARDVLTAHHPLLGAWTSGSLNIGVNVNNPGPLFFDALALPTKLNATAGTAIGSALLNMGAVVGIALFARRRGGTRLLVASMAMVAALMWTMGSELIIEPWQPHSTLLPFLFFLVLVWSMVDGDWAAVPWGVGVVSYILQTHLSYATLLAGLAAVGVVGLGVRLRQQRRGPPDEWPAVRRRAFRATVAGLVVAALAWIQPIVEQLFGAGPGNLTTLATNAGSASGHVGLRDAWRFVASVVAAPPWWLRPSFGEYMRPLDIQPPDGREVMGLVSFPVATLAMTGLGLVLAGAGWVAHRHRDEPARAAVVTATAAVAVGVIATLWMPTGVFRAPVPHHFRWLWPIAVFVTFAVAVALAGRRRWTSVGFGVVLVVLSVLTLPTYRQPAGPSADHAAMPSVRRLADELDSLRGEGTLLFDISTLRFAEPYSGPLMLELQRRGIPFVTTDDGMVHQLGERRRDRGDADARIHLVEGDATVEVPPGERRVAWVQGLSGPEQRELRALTDDLVGLLGRTGVELTERGEQALAYGQLPSVASDAPPRALIDSRELQFMIEEDLLVIPSGRVEDFERYAELQRRWDRHTVAVMLAPLERDVEGEEGG
jgi:hypothetical protein